MSKTSQWGGTRALTTFRQSEQQDFRNEDGEIQHPPSSLGERDIFHRTVSDTQEQRYEGPDGDAQVKEVAATYTRHRIVGFHRKDGVWFAQFANRLPCRAASLAAAVHSADHDWRTTPPPGMPHQPRPEADPGESPHWEYTRWEQPKIGHDDGYPEADSCSDLSFARIHGDGANRIVNQFLCGGADGRVWHRQNGVHGWRYAFIATVDGYITSAAVVEHPHNTSIDNYDSTLYLTRLANHPTRPQNTSSWMLARVRGWLRHHTDYDRLVALAGIDGNEGICYRAADFEYKGEESVTASRDTAYNHDWTKTKWTTALS